MYTITKEDIYNLHDADLRNLIGYLCVAELEAAGESPVGITYGGNQDATDGGVDVRVTRTKEVQVDGSFVPRKQTVLQVKKPKMTPATIKNEMLHNGVLKDSIMELQQNSGAYIIVSSKDDCTDTMLKNRKAAMQECIGQFKNIFIDFYDCSRIATWANLYPSAVIWVCNRLGKTTYAGWQKYGDWSNSRTQELIHDDAVRIKKYPYSDNSCFNMLEAIEAIRNLLDAPKNTVRLTGLSGVGKTRLLQALFDTQIGKNALLQSLAIYTDVGYSPCPEPIHLAETLILNRRRAILLLDNCSAGYHEKVSEICQREDSLLSLITVEYDVREDSPQETHVFNMEPASEEVMRSLLKNRYPQMPDNDIYAIAKYSDGNARIAIALANIYRPGDSYVGLSNKTLTDRLVFQSEAPDDKLKKIAGVLSLVYSFNGTYNDAEDEKTELSILAKIADISPLELYEFCSNLKNRQLIQCRGPWMALLPHMLANHLANAALDRFPPTHILSVLMNGGNERLLMSLSHRIYYLHENNHAKEIATKLLDYIQKSGYPYVSRYMHYMVNYLAPTIPQQVLELISNAIKEGKINGFRTHGIGSHVLLIEQLGYDSACFEQAALILATFAQADRLPNNNSAKHALVSYFQMYLSGTTATPEQRLKMICTFIESNNEYYRTLGLDALRTALSYHQFVGSGACGIPFGMRSRNYGYMPKGDEVKAWYETFTDYACEQIIGGTWTSPEVKSILAENIRGICHCKLISIIENAAERILKTTDWFEGWLACGEMLHHDKDKMDEAYHTRIVLLMEKLKPVSLEARIRASVLVDDSEHFNLRYILGDSDDYSIYEKVGQYVYDLGLELASDESLFIKILPELYGKTTSSYGLNNLGAGFADGCQLPEEHWVTMLDVLQKQDDSRYCAQFMSGFLSQMFQNDIAIASSLSDLLVGNEGMESNILYLLIEADQSPQCHQRIIDHLDKNPHLRWNNLSFPDNPIYKTEDACIELLIKLAERQESFTTIIRLIYMSLPHNKNEKSIWCKYKPALLKLLCLYIKNRSELRNDHNSFMIEEIISFAYRGEEDDDILSETAKALYFRIIADDDYYRKPHCFAFAHSIAKLNPALLLSVFLPDDIDPGYKVEHVLYNSISKKYCLQGCNTDAVLDWVYQNHVERLEKIARIINIVELINNSVKITALAQAIIDSEHISERVLDALMNSFTPGSWSGNLSDILKRRLPAIEPLQSHKNEIVRRWAVKTVEKINERIFNLQQREQAEQNRFPVSFEP